MICDVMAVPGCVKPNFVVDRVVESVFSPNKRVET